MLRYCDAGGWAQAAKQVEQAFNLRACLSTCTASLVASAVAQSMPPHQASPLLPTLFQESIVIVEYPKKLASLVRPTLGPLEKLRDRRYGRTYLAIYGPAAAAGIED